MKNKVIYNPFLPMKEFIPDGEPHILGDRLYLFGSHDRAGGNDYCLDDYAGYSCPLDDLSDWKYEGVTYRKDQDPGNRNGERKLQAPDVAIGPDGRYYMYYCLTVPKWSDLSIEVAVCDEPAGKYEYYGTVKFANGQKLDTELAFDPAIFIDDDGRIYLYFGFAPTFPMRGQPVPESKGGYVVELEKDMLTCKGDPVNIIPSKKYASGTEFEGHAFFEAASMRKIGNKYYFIYCSELTHELCLAISNYPDRDLKFVGTLVSNADIGYKGIDKEHARSQYANIHGSLIQIGEKTYITYHRHTHATQFSRQSCAEEVMINDDGTIDQVQCSSFGFNGGSAPAEGVYPAWIACNMYKGEGGAFIPFGPRKLDVPYIIYINGEGYVCNISDGCTVAFRNFEFPNRSMKLKLSVRGIAEGSISVYTRDAEKADLPAGKFDINLNSADWVQIGEELVCSEGKAPLIIRFEGKGNFELSSIEFA